MLDGEGAHGRAHPVERGFGLGRAARVQRDAHAVCPRARRPAPRRRPPRAAERTSSSSGGWRGQPVEPDHLELRHIEHLADERLRPAADHRDGARPCAQVGEHGNGLGQRPRRSGILDDRRERAVEVQQDRRLGQVRRDLDQRPWSRGHRRPRPDRARSPAPSGRRRRSAGPTSPRERFRAVPITDTCENACGKLPTIRRRTVSYSSDSSPTSLRTSSTSSNSSRASASRPCSARQSASQHVHGMNAPSLAGESVDMRRGVVAPHEPVDHQTLLDRGDGADHALVVRRQEPEQRHHQQRGVERLRPVDLREGTEVVVVALAADLSWISSRSARQRSTGPSNPNSSTDRIARSTPTHAIIFEWTNCWRPPRTSQIPSSGSRQFDSSTSIIRSSISHAADSCGKPSRADW